MPSSNSGESRRATKSQTSTGAAPPPLPEQESLPCPRCDSTNTKFCYYNNYNYSQPRHFCKSCRRYWTHGGTLRDIPVGGGSRKNAKRSRTHHAPTSSSSSSTCTMTSAQEHALPALAPISSTQGVSMQFGLDGDVKQGNANNVNVCGSFTSLLNTTQGSGFLALGGFGLGLGHGFDDMGFGIGRAGWAFPGMVDGANIGANVAGSGVNTWQLDGSEGAFVGGDCFSWPGLAISTPGNGLK